MKKTILSAVALCAFSGLALAGEPAKLGESQLSDVTAGLDGLESFLAVQIAAATSQSEASQTDSAVVIDIGGGGAFADAFSTVSSYGHAFAGAGGVPTVIGVAP